MRRLLPYLAAALLALATDLVLNAISNTVSVPRRYNLLLPVAFAVLVVVTAAVDAYQSDAASGSKNGNKARVTPPPDSEVFTAERRKKADRMAIAVIQIPLWFFSVFLVPGLIGQGISFAIGTTAQHGLKDVADPGEGVPLALIGVLLGIWLVSFTRKHMLGIRARLWISSKGILLKDANGEFSIDWKNVNSFYTSSTFGRGTWLVASVRDDSPLIFRGKTSTLYDANQKVIKICNLDSIGIRKSAVDAALSYRRPRPPAPWIPPAGMS